MPANTAPATLHLHIAAREAVAELRVPGGEGQRFVLPIGCETLWPAPGHSGPSPLALENAIQTVEDQIEGLHRHVPAGSRLVVDAQTLAPLQHAGAIRGLVNGAIGLAVIEHEYQQLAARAMGAPSARDSGFEHAAGDALVLILRECLHHLGFDAVHLAA
ncbi:hypothetical protein [Hydrogenophaga taeniospiralis]|uniref:hypothetical protein n=1 Tax=Hydrogenophaga taeniospiralis TaxID=65656 RepID=UPI001CFB0B1C|nr:hypothetical protein [Hydrogenophaga taeniospiralis]UCU93940.1 hypothetical protein KI616_24920 [Hydrogenophaga taeniospiralis]